LLVSREAKSCDSEIHFLEEFFNPQKGFICPFSGGLEQSTTLTQR
jgi:hypothetical protein